MNSLRRALVPMFALGALAAACESVAEPGVPPGAVELQMQPVADEVAQYLYTGVPDRRRLFIKDVASWTALWEQVTEPYEPPPPVPDIDFASEAVVVVAMGTRSSGGYSITVENVYEDAGQLYVVVRERSPGSNCLLTQALTAPVHAVRVPLNNGTVQFVQHTVHFVERTETHNCQ